MRSSPPCRISTTATPPKRSRARVCSSRVPTPAEGEFYWVDLIGLTVLNRDGSALGTVVGLIETGPHCVLRVDPGQPEAQEVLIPFVDAYVDAVDMAARRITVDWHSDY
jgi:16S rRNA processing protein RimM